MYQKEVVPNCIAMGISYEQFWHLNPRTLECHVKAHQLKLKDADMMNWYMGQYMVSAIASCFDKKAEYVKKPFLENIALTEKQIADKEIRKMIEIERQWSQSGQQKGLKHIED